MSYIGKTVFYQSYNGIPSGEYFVVAERGPVLSVIGNGGTIYEIPTEHLASVEFDPESAADLADRLEKRNEFANASLIRKTLARVDAPTYQELSVALSCATYTRDRLVRSLLEINQATAEALLG